jgi:hypothetical protein
MLASTVPRNNAGCCHQGELTAQLGGIQAGNRLAIEQDAPCWGS